MDLIVGEVSGKGTCLFKGSPGANELGAENLAVFFGKGERVDDILKALGKKVTSIHVFAYVDMSPGEAMDAILKHIHPNGLINTQMKALDSTLALNKERSARSPDSTPALDKEKTTPVSKPPRIRPSRSKKNHEQLADLQEESEWS